MPTREVIEKQHIVGDVALVKSTDTATFAIVQVLDGRSFIRGTKRYVGPLGGDLLECTIWHCIEKWHIHVDIDSEDMYMSFMLCEGLGGVEHVVPVSYFFMVPIDEWDGGLVLDEELEHEKRRIRREFQARQQDGEEDD